MDAAQKPHDVCTLTVQDAQLAYKLAVYQHTRTYAGKQDGNRRLPVSCTFGEWRCENVVRTILCADAY